VAEWIRPDVPASRLLGLSVPFGLLSSEAGADAVSHLPLFDSPSPRDGAITVLPLSTELLYLTLCFPLFSILLSVRHRLSLTKISAAPFLLSDTEQRRVSLPGSWMMYSAQDASLCALSLFWLRERRLPLSVARRTGSVGRLDFGFAVSQNLTGRSLAGLGYCPTISF